MKEFNPVSDEVLSRLARIVPEGHISTAEADRLHRAHDMSQHPAVMSQAVVWPNSAQQAADVLAVANEYRVPVTAWGAGSSLEGNPIPLFGGISLSMERMNAILQVHAEDMQVTVQPGIGYKDLNEQLGRYGLFFGPDPGANASIGGMLANNAAGTRTVKYGATKDNVLAMEVALADGRLVHLGSRSIKQSAGYDLLHLFIGSEGTLGVITQATLKLAPIPHFMSSALASFSTVKAAVDAVVDIRSSGLDVAALEFIGGRNAALITGDGQVDWGEDPFLLMEIHAAHEDTVRFDLQLIEAICLDLGAIRFSATADAAERKKMWRARHHLFETQKRLFPGQQFLVMDVAVPISAYPALVGFTEQSLKEHDVIGLMVGHAGDGNLHVALPYKDEMTRQRVTQCNDAITKKAIALNGTSTGEHGVGMGKIKFMALEHGEAVQVMRSLKQTLDPNGILNPGKIFDGP